MIDIIEQQADGTYAIQEGGTKLVQTTREIQALAASHQTNILLGTACEKRTINGNDVYQNTIVNASRRVAAFTTRC